MHFAESVIAPILFWSAVAIAALGLRVCLHYIDKSFINSVARRKGWKKVKVSWKPMPILWLANYGERHYHVEFTDRDEKRRSRHCKTGILTGVYWQD